MNEEERVELKEIGGLKEISFSDLLNFAILQALKVGIEDVTKYALAVENIESLMIDELDDNYFEIINKKWDELDEKYGIKDELRRLKEFSQFKFRLLVTKVKKKIPIEVEGVL